MEILMAYDGSSGADQALLLAGGFRWSTDSRLHVVAVVKPGLPYAGIAGADVPSAEIDAQLTRYHEELVAEAARRLSADGLRTAGVVLRGRPATVLIDEAERFGADLVIAGSRGHGRVATLVLGSVSAELVDRAPCPVLVARTGPVRRIVLAVDGSLPAARAETLLATWPIFENIPIHVLSVTDVMEPVQFGFAPAPHLRAAAEHASYFAEAQKNHTRIAEEAAGRLRAAGRQVEATMRIGGAANEIIALATEAGADLVVMGSQGRTGLARLLLGSVARNVLSASGVSVLIVRGPEPSR
jgi:nucleotide-binding universal stress UspA family protein